MEKKRKRSRPHLTDQEILEQCVQSFTHSRFTLKQIRSIQEGRLDLWGRTFLGIFLAGPFVMFIPFMAWFNLLPTRCFGLLLGFNAAFLIAISLFYHLQSKRIEPFLSREQERHAHFLSAWFFSVLSWLAFWSSLMVLLGSVGGFVRIHRALLWIPVLIYIAGGIGMWLKRKTILRAIVEGPEAPSWFQPIRLIFAISVGFLIFLAAILRISLSFIEQFHPNLGLLLLIVLWLALALLLMSLVMVAWMISHLHIQRWQGASELKI